jgi:hypothetical protein
MLTEQPLWVTLHCSVPQPPVTAHWPAMLEHEVLVFEEQWIAAATINAMRKGAAERTIDLAIKGNTQLDIGKGSDVRKKAPS